MLVIVFLLRIFIYGELTFNVLLWPTRLLRAYRSQSSAKYSNSQLFVTSIDLNVQYILRTYYLIRILNTSCTLKLRLNIYLQ